MEPSALAKLLDQEAWALLNALPPYEEKLAMVLSERLRAKGFAPEVLSTMLPAGSVSQVWVFFPDPWHKSKHNKRRMVKDTFAPLVARVLAPGGTWRLATDWSTYAEQMLEVGTASADFSNLHDGERTGTDSPLTQARLTGVDCEQSDEPDTTGGWAPRFDGRILTSFENKAHKAGRVIFDLAFRRN